MKTITLITELPNGLLPRRAHNSLELIKVISYDKISITRKRRSDTELADPETNLSRKQPHSSVDLAIMRGNAS